MNKKILSLLGVASVAVGMTTGATSAQASYLSPGALSVETDGGIFFSNNAVDFTAFSTATQNAGTVGTGTVTTPPNFADSQACIFGLVPSNPSTYCPTPTDEILAKLGNRQFTGTNIRITDFEIQGFVNNNETYNLSEAVPYLHFDTDQDGAFGANNSYGTGIIITTDVVVGNELLTIDENGDPILDPMDTIDTDDFTYYITSFERRVVPGEQPGAFNVIFDFDGFFRDGAGQFKDTPSSFSLFNGVTGVDPATLSLTGAPAENPNFQPPENFEFQAGGDGRVGTAIVRQVPEPGTILGLTALAGFGLASRLKRKAK